MALSTFTRILQEGQKASAPTPMDLVSFTGDSSYPTGGYSGFAAKVRTMSGDGRAPLAFIPQDCAGYHPVYDQANDKLKIFWCAGSGAAMSEVTNATDLSAVTFKGLVISV